MYAYNTIDLQLFALLANGANATVASGTMATGAVNSDLSPEMKTYYDMNLIEEATPELVHDQFGQKRPIPKGNGKTIEFRKFAPLEKALTPLDEGTTPKGKKMEVTAMEATVEQYGDYIMQTDVLEMTAIDNTILEATVLLGQQAGLTLDTVVRNELQAGTNVMYCAPVDADGTVGTQPTSRSALTAKNRLTVDAVNQAVAILRSQNAKPFEDGNFVAIIHPYVAYDLMSDPAWIDSHKYAQPENLYQGEIGKVGGVRFVQTTEAKIYTGGDCPNGLAVFGTLFLARNAYGVTEIEGGGLTSIVKQKGSAGTADPLDQRSSVGWKAMRVAKVLVERYMLRVESCSTRFSATAEAN